MIYFKTEIIAVILYFCFANFVFVEFVFVFFVAVGLALPGSSRESR